MSNEYTGFKFNYILWMSDWELARVIAKIPKRDPTDFSGRPELQTLAEACKFAHELVIYRVRRLLSNQDQLEFMKLLKDDREISIEQIQKSKKEIENLVDDLFLDEEIGMWWQKYAA